MHIGLVKKQTQRNHDKKRHTSPISSSKFFFSHPDFNCRFQSFTGSTATIAGHGLQVITCHRRSGITPCPEEIYSINIYRIQVRH